MQKIYNAYSKIDKIKLKQKIPVIISLTTSPKRINHIQPVINTILNQTIPPDTIYLNLPKVFKRTGDKFDKIPDFLNHPKIKIMYVEDIGPITKILPTFQQKFSDDTFIISIDDDILYDKKMIEIMLKYHQEFPDSVLNCSNHAMKLSAISISLNPLPHSKYYFIEGFCGVGYPYKLFKNMVIDLNIPKECYFSDDFILSNYINNKKIPIIRMGGVFYRIYKWKSLNYGLKKDALHNGAGYMPLVKNIYENIHMINYKNCAKYYEQKGELSKELKHFLD
jgi:hypothetical protein